MKRNGLGPAAAVLSIVICALAAVFAVQPAFAQQPVITRGDAVVTGFSGTKTDKDVPVDVHPLDRTFIDLDGASAQVFDLSTLGTAPRGQMSDVAAKLKIKAAETGQVFGVTIDDAVQPNAYLTASSMFGLQIIDKNGERLVTGQADAKWMVGQFGPQATPGAIYKIDGTSGAVSLFATLKYEGRDNAGPALGNITFDPATRQLFVSDLETGLIHRVGLDGNVRDTFDHGVAARAGQGLDAVAYDPARRMEITSPSFNSEDPATWGYADARRRVFGLSVLKGRLYYAVAEGPSIWSVAISENSGFGDDARIELEPDGATASADITDIAFDGAGILILSQRGSISGSYDYSTFAKPQQSSVLRYTYSEKEGRWLAEPQEYAIGLKPDFRATQGGIALSYGYDKYGNVNYGACRQTLWTTGEHLREGDDVVRVATGGARIVSGLQGNYKSHVRPANAPPLEAWFTDYDGRFGDTQAFGHIGDVAIYAPCDPVAGRPVDDSYYFEPIPPPLDEPGLTVDKVCHPGAIGGQIRCTITVHNLTDRIVSQDIKFTDVTRTMFGPGAGTIVPIAAATPLVPGILCAPTPTTDFWCSMSAAILLPGEAVGVDVFIDTHDLALAGNLGFRNCAYLKHPDGYSKACDEGGTDIIVEKIGPGFCLPGGTCKFGLKIANAGTMSYSGDVLLADAMFVGGAAVNAPVTAVNPPILCSAGNTAQLPFTCVTQLSLMPGEEHIHWVDVTMPAPGGYWAKNCFGTLDPALLPLGPVPPGLGGGGAGAGNPSCVWVHVPVPQANLKLEKTALNGGLCDKVGADLHCKYEIAVTNMDAVAFNAPLKIKESVTAGASLIAATAPWVCAGGPPDYTCDTGAAVNIAAGGKTAFNVTVSIPVAVSEATMCKVPNTAKIVMPAGGAAPNLNAADDEASATALTFGLFWVDPITGITFVMCDPTNLKVEKVAKGDCEKDGDQYACGYDVRVTNMGPDPYKGPVKLDEKFATAPTSVTFGGDFACNGAGANYKCETPIVELGKGASLTLTVAAKVAASGICELANTATMTSPPVGSKGNGDGSDDSASATANVPSPRCDRTTTTPPPPKRCPDGKPLPRSGRCPCPDGATWVRGDNACVFDKPEEPKGCTPDRFEIKTDNGRCVCRDGYERRDGRCVEEPEEPKGCTPGPNEIKTPKGRCICADGYERRADGRCRIIVREPEGCTPGPNEFRTGKGRCVCKDGYSRSDNGVCNRDSSPGDDCRANGGKWTGARCVYPTKECPRGYTGKYPDCRIILPDPPKIPKKCPQGTRGLYPNCIDIVPPRCPRGMIGTPGNCHYPKPPKIDLPPKIDMPPKNNRPPKFDLPPKIKLPPKIDVPPVQIFKQPTQRPSSGTVN